MRLPLERERLAWLSVPRLYEAIKERRAAIRKHRGQIGDDRCWVDDWFVWVMLEGIPEPPPAPPPYDEAMRRCREFWINRRSCVADAPPPDAIFDPAMWNDDLLRMTTAELLDELIRIQEAIRTHYVVDHPRTSKDDQQLYAVLPEKIPADFRLPPESEFLGEACAPRAGCPSFWRSHEHCPTECHDLHMWGPCNEEKVTELENLSTPA